MRGLLGAVQGTESSAMSSFLLQKMSGRSANQARTGVED